MDTDPMDMAMPDTPTTPLARGPLMLMPMLMLTTDTDPMVPTLTTDLMATTPLARGPLMPSPLLMPMPTTDTTAMPVPMPTAMLDTEPMVPTPTLMATTPL